jgi:hypothetical protein
MRDSFRIEAPNWEKDENPKKDAKNSAPLTIAERYMELRRLRAQLSEAETLRNAS